MNIYIVEKNSELTGPLPSVVTPGLGTQVPSGAIELPEPLAPAEKGHVWTLVNGDLVQQEDNRGTYYSTTTGVACLLDALGPVPAGLTSIARPDQFHDWSGQGWVLNEAAKAAYDAVVERAWRDTEIAANEWLVSRHRAERDLQRNTTLSNERFLALLEYLQALRDWPAAGAFPGTAERPVPPPWLAEQVQ